MGGDPHNSIYALGDCAQTLGHAHPCTAQVAERQGRYLATSLGHTPSGKGGGAGGELPPEFEFKGWGMLAYVGGYRAIHDTKLDKSQGEDELATALVVCSRLPISNPASQSVLIRGCSSQSECPD